MNRLIALAVAVVAVAVLTGTEASAQTFNKGFQFGAGIRAAGGFRNVDGFNNGFGFGVFGRGVNRIARPPYFAEFPPVYYNGIVRRPYGISPFAAPAGVTPVELQVGVPTAVPVTIKNPFVRKKESLPVSEEKKEKPAESTKDKSARIVNPFFNSNMVSSSPSMHASWEVVER